MSLPIHGNYYHKPCSLCQEDVDTRQPCYYRVLPLRHVSASALQEVPEWKGGCIFIGYVMLKPATCYDGAGNDGGGYTMRAALLHRRCLSFVRHLSAGKLYRLLNVIEPTFLPLSIGPPSECGAFNGLEDAGDAVTVTDTDLARVPAEIWDMISAYGVGRLLFLVKLAAQLSRPDVSPLIIPETRFGVDTVDIPGTIIRIHLVDVGGRTYISHVSDPASGYVQHTYRDYDFGESRYLAVKTDGIGVVDLALDESQAQPNWIFDNPTHPFGKEISRVRDASLHRLRLIRDSMKCRAIIATSRAGVEPYFDVASMPPGNSWVDASLRVGSRLSDYTDPSTYFTKGRYISFENAESIVFYVSLLRLGITQIHINSLRNNTGYSVQFPEKPPTRLKLSVCRLGAGQQHSFIQFDIDGQWEPPTPHSSLLIQQVIVDNVIGLWLGETFPLKPVHLGVVRDESAPRLLPDQQVLKVPDLSTFTSRW